MQKNYSSPMGNLILKSDGEFITEILYREKIFEDETNNILENCARELDDYFAGNLREFSVPIKATGTDFRTRVWEELKKIPYGETITYKELAARIKNPAAIRAVGGANHHNPINIIIPCHRVIGANGNLTGYGGGIENKKFLLELERAGRA
ncbi:MAG: methylated-DNA--[protein]-cysteine S-methyltransferase [Defluviitaleaceae bacterium]|nr:methylated-DNA--[protein]-cysteine S-methyltransferase [Defluviitaleaceae bacterium]